MADLMTEEKNTTGYFSAVGHFRGLNAFALKLIAIITMLIDHASCVFVGHDFSVWRMIGRLACPIFVFMIAEGARRTHNIKKYMLRIFVFALIAEIPFDLALFGRLFYVDYQNVLFTLLLGLVAVFMLQRLKEKKKTFLCVFPLFACFLAAELLCTDYGGAGVLSVFLFFIFADKKPPVRFVGYLLAIFTLSVSIFGVNINKYELYALASIVPIMLYNGEKGHNINKYLFYAFYPGHLLILYLIKHFVLS